MCCTVIIVVSCILGLAVWIECLVGAFNAFKNNEITLGIIYLPFGFMMTSLFWKVMIWLFPAFPKYLLFTVLGIAAIAGMVYLSKYTAPMFLSLWAKITQAQTQSVKTKAKIAPQRKTTVSIKPTEPTLTPLEKKANQLWKNLEPKQDPEEFWAQYERLIKQVKKKA